MIKKKKSIYPRPLRDQSIRDEKKTKTKKIRPRFSI